MVCNKCGVDKPLEDYYDDPKRKSGKQTICKECIKAGVKRRSAERRDEIREYHKKYHLEYRTRQREQDAEYFARVYALKTPCVKCGDERLYIIDFHHIDPTQKSFNIYRKSSKRDFSVIETEAKKCVCLCRNCHGEFHHIYGQRPKDAKKCLEEYLGREVNL